MDDGEVHLLYSPHEPRQLGSYAYQRNRLVAWTSNAGGARRCRPCYATVILNEATGAGKNDCPCSDRPATLKIVAAA